MYTENVFEAIATSNTNLVAFGAFALADKGPEL